MARIHQYNFDPVDNAPAVRSIIFLNNLLSEIGLDGEVYTSKNFESHDLDFKILSSNLIDKNDVLLVHYSDLIDNFWELRSVICKKILVFHGLPAPSIYPYKSLRRERAILAYEQISELKDFVEAAIATTDLNRTVLEARGFADIMVLPVFGDPLDHRRAAYSRSMHLFTEPRYQLISAADLSPTNKQLEFVRFIADTTNIFNYPLHLALIGDLDAFPSYTARVRREIEALKLKNRIKLLAPTSNEEVYGWCRLADAHISFYNDHEACDSVIRAMALDTPVLAKASGVIASVLSGSGTLIENLTADNLIAELKSLLESSARRRSIIEGQQRRLKAFNGDSIKPALADFLAMHLPAVPAVWQRLEGAPSSFSGDHQRFHYFIEGPCETSYSLAIVNRSLGVALSKRPGAQVTFVPAEGRDVYEFDWTAAERYPGVIDLLGDEVPRTPTSVMIRNTYPLRLPGMVADFHLSKFFWEETEVPSQYVRMINRYVDGVIVASNFIKSALRNSGAYVPIAVVGGGVDHRGAPSPVEYNNVRSENQAIASDGDAHRPITFLHISSGLARKGIEELFAAYSLAFKKDDNVRLVIKTYDNETNIVRHYNEKFNNNFANSPAVQIIWEHLSDTEIRDLMSMSDVIVLPTRGEGFNLPAAESMYAGLPVIVTDFSAQRDFCNSENALLVDFDIALSDSHLKTTYSMWAKANVAELATVMRKFYVDRLDSPQFQHKRVRAAQLSAQKMTWAAVAERTETFVNSISNIQTRVHPLKLAWISTWNSKCGIAAYSGYIVSSLPHDVFDISIFADRGEQTLGPDAPNVRRAWGGAPHLSLNELIDTIIKEGYEIVVIQYNYGFFHIEDLERAIDRLAVKGIPALIFLHRTADDVGPNVTVSLSKITQGLSKATRLIVHTVDDVNRLKSYGLVDNVMLIPHGVPVNHVIDTKAARRLIGLRGSGPVIASYGFLMPHKGITELIMAFSYFRCHFTDAVLILLNSQYPSKSSIDESVTCKTLIQSLGLNDSIIFENEFLTDEETGFLLQSADVIVFPYQISNESSSAAVRHGISSGRPVAVTPLKIFDNVRDVVHTLPGFSSIEIADGLRALLQDGQALEKLSAKQQAWIKDTCWPNVAERLAGLLVGLWQDVSNEKFASVVLRSTYPSKDVTRGRDALRSLTEILDANYDLVISKSELPSRAAYRLELNVNDLIYRSAAANKNAPISYKDASGIIYVIVNRLLAEGSDEDFVINLYQALLRREPDVDGLNNHVSLLRLGGVTRMKLLRDILDSEEFISADRPIFIL